MLTPAIAEPRRRPLRPIPAIGALVWRGGQILLVRRARPPAQGAWSVPGGAQKLGETLFEAAIRETWEETGLQVEPIRVVTAIDRIDREPDGSVVWHYTIVDVAARWIAGEPVAADDACDARFVALAEMERLVADPLTRAIIRRSHEEGDSAA